MQLFILILVFMSLGYFLARVDAEREAASPVEQPSGKASWWRRRFGQGGLARRFRAWVLGSGATLFPEEFRNWLASLAKAEGEDFIQALDSYLTGLGFSLKQGIKGDLDRDPRMKSVFVEAIVVYRQAYRKAKKANKEAEEQGDGQAEQNPGDNGKKPAEKSVSRRRSEAELLPEAVAAA